MNIYDFYISPEEYARAAQNGINAKLLDWRIREALWDKEKAITTPPAKSKRYPEYIKKLIKKNSISMRTFKSRVNKLGWDQLTAATTPIMDNRKNIYKAIPKVIKYPQEYISLARKNGIPDKTFYQRIKRDKWSMEKAATTPVMTIADMIKNRDNSNHPWRKIQEAEIKQLHEKIKTAI